MICLFLFYYSHFSIAQTGFLVDSSSFEKPFDEISWPCTHNSYNYQKGENAFFYPNQNEGILSQLSFGIRAFMLDIHHFNGGKNPPINPNEILLFHGYSILGHEPLSTTLNQIKEFLLENPNEIVTLIFESTVNQELVVEEIGNVGLLSMCWAQTMGEKWPTLSQMIEENKRLVIFSDKANGKILGYHSIWEFCIETPYSNTDPDNYKNYPNRGRKGNSILIMNHFITGTIFRKSKNKRANSGPFLIKRAKLLSSFYGKNPSFLVIDWYKKSGIMEACLELNNPNPKE